MKTTEPPVVVEHVFEASKGTIWKAITDPDEMRKWYFEQMEDFKPEVGFKTNFLVTNEGREFPHYWEVTEVDAFKKITYNWKFPNYPGDSYVTFSIREIGSDAELSVKVTVTEDFPDEIPEFKRASCLGGWNYFIKQRLKDYLN